MKVITEQFIRTLIKEKGIREFHVGRDSVLSPAAKDYLNQEHVRVFFDLPASAHASAASDGGGEPAPPGGYKYVDDETGAGYGEKPEYMTHLTGNRLVFKDHERIVLRGELDHLQSQIVLAQAATAGKYSYTLISDLDNVLAYVRGLLRAEVLDEAVNGVRLLGLDGDELREQSHHPEKYCGVRAMTLPCQYDKVH